MKNAVRFRPVPEVSGDFPGSPCVKTATRSPVGIGLTIGLLLLVLPGIRVAEAQHQASLLNGIQIEGEAMRAVEIFVAGQGQILAINDDVRRYWFHSQLLRNELAAAPPLPEEVFDIPQPHVQESSSGDPQGIHIVSAQPFDEFGRRICTVTTGKVPTPRIVHQGITRITPRYFVVRCLNEKNAASITWEMRFLTSTLPRDTLSRILRHQVKSRNDLDGRLRIVAFYRQAEKYREAMLELKALFRDFPEQRTLRKKQIQALSKAQSDFQLRQIRQLLDVGQYNNARKMVSYFRDRQVDDETLVELGDMEAEAGSHLKDRETILENLEGMIAELKQEEKLLGENAIKVDALLAIWKKELNRNNLSRLADFYRFIDDPSQQADEKISLAITGWLMGAGAGKQNYATALSLISVRDLVHGYLMADNPVEREEILKKMESMEGASVENIERIVAQLLPYGDLKEAEPLGPGCYRISVPSLTEGQTYEYEIQLPPEYDPYRRYPCIVTLCGEGSTPGLQLDWWAGDAPPDQTHRAGYAGYNGYIVIAPLWRKKNQAQYGYTAHEHAAVLRSLLDAKKKFSINSDRVFLSGHSMGGDAAWDIGLSHPSLWAGVIPIAASNAKYIRFYSANLKQAFPVYFVHGEHDYVREEANLPEWKDYMLSAKNDVIVCQYIGRVHEHFYEEIENLFRWMKVQKRRAPPTDFKCLTYRPWDNFFWWIEVNNMERTNTILPEEWISSKPRSAQGKNKAAATVSVSVSKNSTTGNYVIRLQAPAANSTVWLSGETFDLTKRFKINGRNVEVKPEIETLLEDVRLRRDRQHPFRARIDLFRKQSAWQQIVPGN
ncbi:MAG: peptidase [Planctomycetota bacterium]|nr:peptidase [Planctomycetota bacterium]